MTKWLNRLAYAKGYCDCFRDQSFEMVLMTGFFVGATVMFFMLAII